MSIQSYNTGGDIIYTGGDIASIYWWRYNIISYWWGFINTGVDIYWWGYIIYWWGYIYILVGIYTQLRILLS